MPRIIPGLIAAALVAVAACSTPQPQELAVQPPPQSVAPSSMEKDERIDEARAQLHELKAQSTPMAAGAAAYARGKMAPAMAALQANCCVAPQPIAEDRETYGRIEGNPVRLAAEHPVSTFSIDVDTGSYSNVRRLLKEGRLPPSDAVRVEEMVNYFDYAYAPPTDTSTPFAVATEIAPAPWNAKAQLLRIGIQGWKPQGPRVASNLVFLVDVSGSMEEPNKLPLVKSALKLLASDLTHADRISLVVYAGNTGVVLEPTPGDQEAVIDAALDRLEAGGSTNGGAGIELAYAMAHQAWIEGGNNRVLLATDGDFNVGTVSFDRLLDMVKDRRKSGIALTTLGFGEGNYNDRLMEQLADAGNGNYAYIDSINEARKVLVEQRDATLRTIARDVKIQIEFNPALVSEYRLIGYENRMLKREDFNKDQVDAGEIGAGHTVTALYEVTLAGSGGGHVDPLHFGHRLPAAQEKSDELAWLRLRYKRPEDGINAASRLIERPVRAAEIEPMERASQPFRLAAAVAAFGQLLRGGSYTGGFHYTDVEHLAREARGDDRHGYADEFLQLVGMAQKLSGQAQQVSVSED